ncbi:hypothetical protein CONLIGDRAFT_684944 [Coniochaeta ligniaria NRRL 30616]|uniref:Uncharacterized protein n=1 Tax=Coniochaeta ligniaria NRRL 30616 TaxID=1408157 RepID=A0A1J7IBL2_9PEZI|nr:hypothetical protein CONLIGDRAFT_684944 [Coniochaeta ligniaria NRRL 30616]
MDNIRPRGAAAANIKEIDESRIILLYDKEWPKMLCHDHKTTPPTTTAPEAIDFIPYLAFKHPDLCQEFQTIRQFFKSSTTKTIEPVNIFFLAADSQLTHIDEGCKLFEAESEADTDVGNPDYPYARLFYGFDGFDTEEEHLAALVIGAYAAQLDGDHGNVALLQTQFPARPLEMKHQKDTTSSPLLTTSPPPQTTSSANPLHPSMAFSQIVDTSAHTLMTPLEYATLFPQRHASVIKKIRQLKQLANPHEPAGRTWFDELRKEYHLRAHGTSSAKNLPTTITRTINPLAAHIARMSAPGVAATSTAHPSAAQAFAVGSTARALHWPEGVLGMNIDQIKRETRDKLYFLCKEYNDEEKKGLHGAYAYQAYDPYERETVEHLSDLADQNDAILKANENDLQQYVKTCDEMIYSIERSFSRRPGNPFANDSGRHGNRSSGVLPILFLFLDQITQMTLPPTPRAFNKQSPPSPLLSFVASRSFGPTDATPKNPNVYKMGRTTGAAAGVANACRAVSRVYKSGALSITSTEPIFLPTPRLKTVPFAYHGDSGDREWHTSSSPIGSLIDSDLKTVISIV